MRNALRLRQGHRYASLDSRSEPYRKFVGSFKEKSGKKVSKQPSSTESLKLPQGVIICYKL